jgi:glycosyltransferase involved in cell wall biosynthesis
LRLGLLIYGSLETLSGGYLYDRKLVETLRKAGDTVEIISLPWRSYARHLWDNLSAALPGRLAALEVDVLLQDELNHPSLFAINRKLKKQARYPILAIVHHLRCSEAHPAWANWLYRRVERTYLNTVDGFIFNSQTTRQVVGGLLAKEHPGLVAYPAGDRFGSQAGSEDRYSDGPLRILFLGNVIRRKGLGWVLDELEGLPDVNWQLDVVGSLSAEPVYAAALQRQAGGMRDRARVHFHGALTDSAVGDWLADSQVLVAPSSYEGFGIVTLEAMGFGVVPVGSMLGAAGEIIEHNKNGYLVRPGAKGELSRIIMELARDRERLAAMSLAARQRFLSFPTWEESMGQIRPFLTRFVQDWSKDGNR